MDVVVTQEQRFDRLPDGSVWTASPFAYPFFERYLRTFDGVVVVARVQPVDAVVEGARRADGDAVRFVGVPSYIGPSQYLRVARQAQAVVTSAVPTDAAVVLRVPSQVASCVHRVLRRRSQPYGVEVVGNPHDVFARGVVDHPLRPALRWHFTRNQVRQCAGAVSAAYTTTRVLQERYPCPGLSSWAFHLPIAADSVVGAPRPAAATEGPLRVVTVGSLEQLYKGTDVLIDALARCASRPGPALELVVVGGGRYLGGLRDRADRAGVGPAVRFLGHLPAGPAVRAELDAADLFVLPSRTEGSPAAIVEAMARGLPCVATAVGGVVELLAPEDLVLPGDAVALADCMAAVAADADRRAAMAERNLVVAAEHTEAAQAGRWDEFYRSLAAETTRWAHGPGPTQPRPPARSVD